MELGLSLGSSRPFGFMENPPEASNTNTSLSIGPVIIITKQRDQQYHQQQKQREENSDSFTTEEDREATIYESLTSPNSLKANNNNAVLQLDLLPHTPPAVAPMNFFPFHAPPLVNASGCSRGMGMNMLPAVATAIVRVEDEAEEEAVLSSSPNSVASSIFQMDLCMFSTRGRGCSSRASDENENSGDGRSRKKLRLSKEQSNFLEESFKEHNTLNPKQKIALAKQLHLRPRQVEVWFQNKRARNKLKQTELDCEDLKRCCDTLKEENRRLHKELEELRALKITSKPFYMQLPATTLTMCPSCSERVATNNSIISTPSRTVHCSRPDTTIAKTIDEPKAIGFPRFNPIFHSTAS